MIDEKELALEAIEVAKNTGKIKKGVNEATKALERGIAKLVVYAKDTQPVEITMHIPILAKEKGIPCIEVPSKEELGTAAGIPVSTSAVAVLIEGDANIAVLPHKFTVKSDADHDGDKVFIYRNDLETKDGKTLVKENTTLNEDSINSEFF